MPAPERTAGRSLAPDTIRPMPRSTSSPRMTPVAPADRSAQEQELLEGVAPPLRAANIFTTLVRAPGLFRRWLPFGGKLLTGKIPARDREILILRTAWNCGADYEWGHHVTIGLDAGLTREEIDRVPEGPTAAWPAPDALLLQAADELHREYRLSDATWDALRQRYDTQQLVEVPMLVGHYHLVAMTLRTLGVELEPGYEELPR
jgi:4-carboxymuconolactone decarboxylase